MKRPARVPGPIWAKSLGSFGCMRSSETRGLSSSGRVEERPQLGETFLGMRIGQAVPCMREDVELRVGQQAMERLRNRHRDERAVVGMEQQHWAADRADKWREIATHEYAERVEDRYGSPCLLRPCEGRP